MKNIEIKCLPIGIKCEVCNEIPKGFNNTYVLKIGIKQIEICDECLQELSLIIEN